MSRSQVTMLLVLCFTSVHGQGSPYALMKQTTGLSDYDFDTLAETIRVNGPMNVDILFSTHPAVARNIQRFNVKYDGLSYIGKQFINKLFNCAIRERLYGEPSSTLWNILQIKLHNLSINQCNSVVAEFPALDQLGGCGSDQGPVPAVPPQTNVVPPAATAPAPPNESSAPATDRCGLSKINKSIRSIHRDVSKLCKTSGSSNDCKEEDIRDHFDEADRLLVEAETNLSKVNYKAALREIINALDKMPDTANPDDFNVFKLHNVLKDSAEISAIVLCTLEDKNVEDIRKYIERLNNAPDGKSLLKIGTNLKNDIDNHLKIV